MHEQDCPGMCADICMLHSRVLSYSFLKGHTLPKPVYCAQAVNTAGFEAMRLRPDLEGSSAMCGFGAHESSS